MATIYSAADLMVVPSRQDNLPNTAVEAHACGTPVAAFNIGGLPDIVEHQQTGWLAPAFDTENLAQGIIWVLSEQMRLAALGLAGRKTAVERYHPSLIAAQYAALYQAVLVR